MCAIEMWLVSCTDQERMISSLKAYVVIVVCSKKESCIPLMTKQLNVSMLHTLLKKSPSILECHVEP